MPKKKGNWTYYFSKALNMEFAHNSITGEVMTEDKVLYSAKEIEILRGKPISPGIHLLKKIFNGEVVCDGQ